ncbi:MAG: GNAT family N-acetyltransferase [Phycisphaerales bacterium JB038]
MNDLISTISIEIMPPGFDPGGFDCEEPDITEYLCDGSAARDCDASYSQTYLLRRGEELVGYFSVLADSIRLQGGEKPDGVRYPTAPAVTLGRMGVDASFRGNGVGTFVLDYVVGMARALSDDIGVRYVTLDALKRDSLVAWYSNYGFVKNKAVKAEWTAVQKFAGRFKKGQEPPTVSMRYDVLLEEEVLG